MTDTVEINARDLAELQRLAQSGKVAEQVWNDPKHGMSLKALVKEAIPDANIPELDVLNQTNKVRDEASAKFDAMAERMAKYEEENNKRLEAQNVEKEEAKFASRLEAVRKSKNFTDEGMKKVIDRMKEHNNPDVEAAAAWVLSQEPRVPTKSAYAPQPMDLFGANSADQEVIEWNQNPVSKFDKTVAEILNDPQYN